MRVITKRFNAQVSNGLLVARHLYVCKGTQNPERNIGFSRTIIVRDGAQNAERFRSKAVGDVETGKRHARAAHATLGLGRRKDHFRDCFRPARPGVVPPGGKIDGSKARCIAGDRRTLLRRLDELRRGYVETAGSGNDGIVTLNGHDEVICNSLNGKPLPGRQCRKFHETAAIQQAPGRRKAHHHRDAVQCIRILQPDDLSSPWHRRTHLR